MKFLRIGKNKYVNINKIILIEDYSTTYPNTTTIIHFENNGNIRDTYAVLPIDIDEVIKIIKNEKDI